MTFHEKLQALEKAVKDLSEDHTINVNIHMKEGDVPPDDYIPDRGPFKCEHCQPIEWLTKEFSKHNGITLHIPLSKE